MAVDAAGEAAALAVTPHMVSVVSRRNLSGASRSWSRLSSRTRWIGTPHVAATLDT